MSSSLSLCREVEHTTLIKQVNVPLSVALITNSCEGEVSLSREPDSDIIPVSGSIENRPSLLNLYRDKVVKYITLIYSPHIDKKCLLQHYLLHFLSIM